MSTTFTMAGNGTDSTSERIADSMHRTVDRVADKAGGVERDLRARIAALRAEAREQEERALDALSAGLDETQSYARAKPLLAMGIAFAASILAIGLLRRR